jgi:hypothetical protein
MERGITIYRVGPAKELPPGTLTSHPLGAWKTTFLILRHFYACFGSINADIGMFVVLALTLQTIISNCHFQFYSIISLNCY